jgi:exodeoxyribonuclease-3
LRFIATSVPAAPSRGAEPRREAAIAWPDVRLVTWNVNSLHARLPRVLELLAEHRPDVACLQETKVERDAFPHDELARAGYRAVDHSAGRWAGVAIVARDDLEIADSACGLPGEPAVVEARWVEATVAGVHVASVYVPNGRAVGSDSFVAKIGFLDALGEHAAVLAGGETIVAGDFNVCRTDLDVYDPAEFVGSTHVTPEERQRLERVIERGFVDAFRELHPDEPGFTWWDYRAGHFHRKMGLRIDLTLVSAALADRVRSCGIDRSYRKGPRPSDHAPLLLELA